MKINGFKRDLQMNFQVVEVHKALLAVSKIIEAGHQVVFSKEPHVLLSSGERIPLQCNGSKYEMTVWLKNAPADGFSGPSR